MLESAKQERLLTNLFRSFVGITIMGVILQNQDSVAKAMALVSI